MDFDWHNPTVDRDALAASVAGGAKTAVVRLDGARPEVHAATCQTPSYAAALQALSSARGLGLGVGVKTVVHRSNTRVMSELPALLRARGVRAWRVELPHYPEVSDLIGRAPRLVLALPSVLSALTRAARLGLRVELVDAPLCLLGPLRTVAARRASRAYGAPCEGCAQRPACVGVDAAYLTRFGDAELRRQSVEGRRGPEGRGAGSPATRAGRKRSSGATSQGGSGTSSSS